MNRLVGMVREKFEGTDGLFLAMHGAGSAEGITDLEAETLRRIRAITGRDFPIMSSLDIHCTITPEMLDLSDGFFEVLLVKMPQNLGELNRILYALTARDYTASPAILLTRARSLTVTAAERLPWSLDGEYAPGDTRAVIRAIPHALKIIT
jgi:hypothetical protein